MYGTYLPYRHQADRRDCSLLMRIDTRFNVACKKTVFNPQKNLPSIYNRETHSNNTMDYKNNTMVDTIDSDQMEAMYALEEDERLNKMIIDNQVFDALHRCDKIVETNSSSSSSTTTTTTTSITKNVKQPKTINLLMEKFDSGSLDVICLTFDELLRNFRHKGQPLIKVLYDNKNELENIVKMYINRMMLGLFSLDKVGIKLSKMIDRIEALYYCSGYIDDPRDSNPKKKRKLPIFVEKFMNDFANVDAVRSMIENRVRDGAIKENDDFYKILSSAKQRGRRKKTAVEYSYNSVETIAKSFIKSKKLEPKSKNAIKTSSSLLTNTTTDSTAISSTSGSEEDEVDEDDKNETTIDGGISEHVSSPPTTTTNTNPTTTTTTTTTTATTDLYPTFQKCLEVLNQSIPRYNNHGWLLEPVTDCLRYLNNTDFPAHDFLATVNNMFCCVAHNKIVMSFDHTQRRFYCAITGEEIMNGEEVYRFLFIEKDAEREKDWVDYKIVEPRVFEQEKITKSVKAYLVKMKTTSLPITLFPKKRNLDNLQDNTTTTTTTTTAFNMKQEDNSQCPVVTKKRKIEIKQKKNKKLVIHGKEYVRQTIVNLLFTLKTHPDPSRLCHNNKKYYTIENERINTLLGLINGDNFRTIFDKILHYVIVSSYSTQQQSSCSYGDGAKKLRYDKNRLYDDLIDFILVIDTADIPYSTLHPVLTVLFKLSLQKKNTSTNRFTSFTEWDPNFHEHLLFFLTIAELMEIHNKQDADITITHNLLETFNITVM